MQSYNSPFGNFRCAGIGSPRNFSKSRFDRSLTGDSRRRRSLRRKSLLLSSSEEEELFSEGEEGIECLLLGWRVRRWDKGCQREEDLSLVDRRGSIDMHRPFLFSCYTKLFLSSQGSHPPRLFSRWSTVPVYALFDSSGYARCSSCRHCNRVRRGTRLCWGPSAHLSS